LKITAVILAGGRATRMGGIDKGLVLLDQKPLIEYVIEVLESEVDEILISANRNIESYQVYGYPIVADRLPNFAGPLAGLLAAMEQASHQWVLCVPCDAPFIQVELIQQLKKAVNSHQVPISVAFDGVRLQPTFSLYSKDLYPDLGAFIARGNHAIKHWIKQNKYTSVNLSHTMDSFINLNTLKDIEDYEKKN
jgi:molybdenum cofactor guanylyltransferase